LLLIAANSKKCILGEGNDKVCISPKVSIIGRDAYEGEIILCFQLDERTDREKRVPHSLGIPEDHQRCDGLVFYAQDETMERVICLVEMKSTNVTDAASQIIATKEHIEKLLREECNALPQECRSDCRKQIAHITWKACLYHHGASPDKVRDCQKQLKNHGFDDIDHLTVANNDLRPLLSGEGRSAKEMAKKYKSGRKR
jgi:hypothetical protein